MQNRNNSRTFLNRRDWSSFASGLQGATTYPKVMEAVKSGACLVHGKRIAGNELAGAEREFYRQVQGRPKAAGRAQRSRIPRVVLPKIPGGDTVPLPWRQRFSVTPEEGIGNVHIQRTQSPQIRGSPNGVGTKGIYVAKAENSEIWDVDGRRYIDFAAGIAVVNTGHRHPKVMAAVAQQAQAFAHTCFHVASYESYVHLAERLECLGSRRISQEDAVLEFRRGGGRKCHQDCPLPHQAVGGHRIFGRIPRPYPYDHGADRQGHALQARLRAVSR